MTWSGSICRKCRDYTLVGLDTISYSDEDQRYRTLHTGTIWDMCRRPGIIESNRHYTGFYWQSSNRILWNASAVK